MWNETKFSTLFTIFLQLQLLYYDSSTQMHDVIANKSHDERNRYSIVVLKVGNAHMKPGATREEA